MSKRLLPLQPAHTTPYYGFFYLTIFFVCISKSYWLFFAIPYIIISGIGNIIIKVNMIKSRDENKQTIHWQKRDYSTYNLVAALLYISIWQSMSSSNTPYTNIDYIIALFFIYSHFCVTLQFMHFHSHLFSKFKIYRLCIGWIAELHFCTSLCSLYIFPVYPITTFYIHHNILDQNKHKYSTLILYIILYCYILYSLLISFTPDNPNQWTYFKIDPIKSRHSTNSKSVKKSKPIPLKFNQYYIGNNIKLNNGKHKLRICQISDCHLDSLWTANELRKLCEHIVHFNPDLVLLTGDFYYTKNDDIPKGLLKYALNPLTKIADKCFGCLGNHDMKTKQIDGDILTCVEAEFEKLNIKLLRNESVLFNEKIEIFGFDFVKYNIKNQRANMMKNVLKKSKLTTNSSGCLKIVLLHNPNDFNDFDGDENIIVFSGHVHAGRVGFYALGPWFRNFSLYRMLKKAPDYGVWRKGNNYMYVHKANVLWSKGILRFGIPAEQQTCILINECN